jgi:hypothetical protein
VVAVDVDNDGDMDFVSASSTDNKVALYINQGSQQQFTTIPLTRDSNGARILTAGDIDGDGDVDIIVASYYDHTVGWFRNNRGLGSFSNIIKITESAFNAQGVAVSDIDGDGDLDVISVSSGDNTIAWYENLGEGSFCDVKRVVTTDAVGARTVIAADFDGDGDVDLASASKDDNTIAWYKNLDSNGTFTDKIVINAMAKGAYSLVASDINTDGNVDIITASNGDNTVAVYQNLGDGKFSEAIIITSSATFVLSVTVGDFDGDGDIDVASAHYFGDSVEWHENVDGQGLTWVSHKISTTSKLAHYVFATDFDGDGDVDLATASFADNAIEIFEANSTCTSSSSDGGSALKKQRCCRLGQFWNQTRVECQPCPGGTFGMGVGMKAQCVPCQGGCNRRPSTDFVQHLPGAINAGGSLVHTCYAQAGAAAPARARARGLCGRNATSPGACSCPPGLFQDNVSTVCVPCAAPRVKPGWGKAEGMCQLPKDTLLHEIPGMYR